MLSHPGGASSERVINHVCRVLGRDNIGHSQYSEHVGKGENAKLIDRGNAVLDCKTNQFWQVAYA